MCGFASRKGHLSNTSYFNKLKEDITTIKEDILDYYHTLAEPQPVFLPVPPLSPSLTRRSRPRTSWAESSRRC